MINYANTEIVLFAIEHKHLMNKEIAVLINDKFGLNLNDKAVSRLRQKHNFPSTNNGRFKKGDVPFIKGTKGYAKANITSFKKGNKPHNAVPIGTEVIKADGYLWVKINDNPGSHNKAKRWKQKSNIVYEQHHNVSIKSNERVLHLDLNKLNNDPSNLVLVESKHLAILNRNRLLDENPQISSIGVTTSKIKSTLVALNRRFSNV